MKISNGVNKKISFPIAIIIIVVCAVLVGGVAVWQYLETPKGEEISEKITPKDETADWKIYRNEEYNYEIKYPEDWDFKDYRVRFPESYASYELSDIRFEPRECYGTVKIMVYNNSRGLSSTQWINFYYAPQCFIGDKELVRVVGVLGTETTYSCGEFSVRGIFLSKENKIYSINFLLSAMEETMNSLEECDRRIYNQILSTFRFLE